MVEFEADDGRAGAAATAAADARVAQVVVCTPDKDLAQCVRGDRVVQLDRRTRELRDESAVRQKFGVAPTSLPDWLALVGDSADGYPGLPRWGAKSASAVLGRYARLEAIPELERDWKVPVRGAAALGESLRAHRDEAQLFRRLATLRTDADLPESLADLRWRGARRGELEDVCHLIREAEAVPRTPAYRPSWSRTHACIKPARGPDAGSRPRAAGPSRGRGRPAGGARRMSARRVTALPGAASHPAIASVRSPARGGRGERAGAPGARAGGLREGAAPRRPDGG